LKETEKISLLLGEKLPISQKKQDLRKGQMMNLRVGKDKKTKEFWLYRDEVRWKKLLRLPEGHGDREVRGLGYLPLEEALPGEVTEDYVELDLTLYLPSGDNDRLSEQRVIPSSS
jgi:hypothetical protein